MDLRVLGRNLSLIALPFALATFPAAAIVAAGGFVALAPRRRATAWEGPAMLVGMALFVSAAFSGRAADAMPTVLLLGALGGLLLTWQSRLVENDGPPLLAGLALAMILLGLRAAIEVFVLGLPRAHAGQLHPNLLGSFAAMGLPILLAGLARTPAPALRALLLVGGGSGAMALTLSGSRGALVAFGLALIVLVAFVSCRSRTWRRHAGWTALLVLGLVAAGAAAALLGARSANGDPNLLVNADFAAGAAGWTLGGRSSITSVLADEPGATVTLVQKRGGPATLLQARPVPADEGAAYAVGLRVRVESGFAPAFVRVEALDETGARLARAGLEGWTAGAEVRVGGPLALPSENLGAWQTVTWALHATPPGTRALRLSLVSPHRGDGVYATVSALQLQPGEDVDVFTPGPRPGASVILDPITRRLPFLTAAGAGVPDRPLMWALALELAAQRPFLGYGPGAFQALVPTLEASFPIERSAHSHSLYLQLLLDGGSLLLVTALAWGLALGATLYNLAREGGGPLAAAALGVLVGGAAHNAFDVLWAQPVLVSVLWVGLGIGSVDREPLS